MEGQRPTVGLMVTCLVDLFRPAVGFATVTLLERAGYRVEVPESQTCCGQPAFNSGDRAGARELARRTIAAFEGHDFLVAPSGSCIGTVHQYPELFEAGDPWRARAEALKAKAFEVTSFLVEVAGLASVDAELKATATYHDSCSGLRELGIKRQPRRLLERVRGLKLVEMEDAEGCCGFGGTFCVKYPAISGRMVGDKAARVRESGAGLLLGGDLGCLLNVAGRLSREGAPVEVRHVVEVLAGADGPAIGEPGTE